MSNRKTVDEISGLPRVVSIRSDVGRMRKASDPKVGLSMKALDALRIGLPPHPGFTPQERIALAVTSTQPSQHVTITTPGGATHQELARGFRKLVPRIERNAHRRKQPLIYVGNYAKGRGNGGYHLHLLLWEEPYMCVYRRQCLAAGLGRARNTHIDPVPEMVLYSTSYVLGQHESVFGTDVHLRHRPRAKGKRSFICPQGKTLETYHPELFYALQLAKDKSVTDETLVSECPIFI